MSEQNPAPTPHDHQGDAMNPDRNEPGTAARGGHSLTVHRPLHYNPPREQGGHWSITDDSGRVMVSPHTPPVPELLALLTQAAPAPQGSSDCRTHAAEQARVVAPTTGPTPAVMPSRAATPTPFAFTPSATTWEWMERHSVPMDKVRSIIEDPYTSYGPVENFPGRAVYVGQGYRVVVAEDDKVILGIYPLMPLWNGAWDKRKTSGTKHDDRAPLPTDVAEMVELLEHHGFKITAGSRSGHRYARHEALPGAQVTMPSTPSDWRWAANFIAEVRAVFGVDLREPPASNR